MQNPPQTLFHWLHKWDWQPLSSGPCWIDTLGQENSASCRMWLADITTSLSQKQPYTTHLTVSTSTEAQSKSPDTQDLQQSQGSCNNPEHNSQDQFSWMCCHGAEIWVCGGCWNLMNWLGLATYHKTPNTKHNLKHTYISVAAALAGVFAILVNKICKIMAIFE